MNARLLFILLIITVLLAFTAKFRRLGVVLSGVLLLLLIWFNVAPPAAVKDERAANGRTLTVASLPSPVIINLPASTLQLLDIQLTGDGAPWQLKARVRNTNSDAAIKSFTLQITRFDCPTISAASVDCSLNWHGDHTVRVLMPAAATQMIDETIWSHDTPPRVQGVSRTEVVVTNVQVAGS